jgi:hypothetical protein
MNKKVLIFTDTIDKLGEPNMKKSLVCFATGLLLSFTSIADVNVLIVGSTGDSRSIVANTVGSSSPFDPTSVRTYLQSILQDAGHGTVNVQVENRSSPYDLLSWFYGPAGGNTSLWSKLRGEAGTD